MPIQIRGVEAILKAVKGAAVKDAINISEGLKKCAEILLRASQKLVPVDTGQLKLSGQVVTEDGKGFAAESVVQYGGLIAPYAFIVHERLDVYHAPPTQARYLVDAIPKVRGTMVSVLKRQVKTGTGPAEPLPSEE